MTVTCWSVGAFQRCSRRAGSVLAHELGVDGVAGLGGQLADVVGVLDVDLADRCADRQHVRLREAGQLLVGRELGRWGDGAG